MSRYLAILAMAVSLMVMVTLESASAAEPGSRRGTRPGSRKYFTPPRVERPVDSGRRSVPSTIDGSEQPDIAIPVRRVRLLPAIKGIPESGRLLRGCR
ncbi:MAG: hypothetical protein H8E44_22190 [Planctomycetes bacterium]|nr:hypothetical protein [Planctomycetota bacterium]